MYIFLQKLQRILHDSILNNSYLRKPFIQSVQVDRKHIIYNYRWWCRHRMRRKNLANSPSSWHWSVWHSCWFANSSYRLRSHLKFFKFPAILIDSWMHFNCSQSRIWKSFRKWLIANSISLDRNQIVVSRTVKFHQIVAVVGNA